MQNRLSTRMLFMVLLPVFVCTLLLVFLLIAFNAAYDVVVGVQEENLRELVRLGSSSIDRLWISPREKSVEALARSPLLQKRIRGEIPFAELHADWESIHPALEGCFFIYYGLEDGTIELYPDLDLPEDYDHRERPWYKKGINLETTSPAWTAPFAEIITGQIIVSTVVQLRDVQNRPIGVFAVDITLKGLQEILNQIQLPQGSSIFLLDTEGTPFVGTVVEDARSGGLPGESDKTFVEYSSPLSNGWRIAVVVPRKSMARSFERLRSLVLGFSFLLFILSAGTLAFHVIKLASRAHRLASYFEEVMMEKRSLGRVFRSNDEFSFLNKQFNKVILATRRAENEKLSREQVFRFIIERSPIGFFRTRSDGSLLYANPYFTRLLGYSSEELETIDSVERFYADREDRKTFLAELSEKHEVQGRRIRFQRKSGDFFWISMNSLIVPGQENREVFEIEGFLIDATDEVEEQERLRILAETDPLTNLANRRAFFERFSIALGKAHQNGDPISLIIFDVDRFKPVNDTHGHDLGDEILRLIADAGEKIIRKGDVFARLGGDEFALLLPASSGEEARGLAFRLQTGIAQIDPPDPLDSFPSISIGICCHGDAEDCSIDELYKKADTALYEAKAAGRNRIVLYTPAT